MEQLEQRYYTPEEIQAELTRVVTELAALAERIGLPEPRCVQRVRELRERDWADFAVLMKGRIDRILTLEEELRNSLLDYRMELLAQAPDSSEPSE